MGFREENTKERLAFVDYWSAYVLNHTDKEWSRQQNIIINSGLKNSSMTREQYLHMKKENYKQ